MTARSLAIGFVSAMPSTPGTAALQRRIDEGEA